MHLRLDSPLSSFNQWVRAEHAGHAHNFPSQLRAAATVLSGAGLQFLPTPPPGPALPTESCRTEVLQRTVPGCSFSSRTQSPASAPPGLSGAGRGPVAPQPAFVRITTRSPQTADSYRACDEQDLQVLRTCLGRVLHASYV